MKFLLFFKISLLIIGLFTSMSIFSQSLYPPKVESPNAASLGKFGEVPVGLYTGTPNISIPIYTLSYGNINLPISLRYNAASVKPAQQPGWVGSGWDLESIGTISRQVRGQIDESYISDDYSGNVRSYYPYPSTSSWANASNFGSYLTNLGSWYMQGQMAYDFFPSDAQNIDVEADEFSFNFLGHAGKFYYSGTTKGWQVVSDENIKVEMTQFITPAEVGNAIHDYLLTNGQTWEVPVTYQSRQFGSFTLTVPDGTKFIFGGKIGNNVPDAIEFYSPIGNTTIPNYTANPIMTANTWLLKSIIDIYGSEVDFSYARKYPTCNKFYTSTYFGVNVYAGSSCTDNITGGANFDKNKLSGIFQWPMYLSSLTCPNGSVRFTMSETSYNRCTNAQLSMLG